MLTRRSCTWCAGRDYEGGLESTHWITLCWLCILPQALSMSLLHSFLKTSMHNSKNNTKTSVTVYLDEKYTDPTKVDPLGVATLSDPQFNTSWISPNKTAGHQNKSSHWKYGGKARHFHLTVFNQRRGDSRTRGCCSLSKKEMKSPCSLPDLRTRLMVTHRQQLVK